METVVDMTERDRTEQFSAPPKPVRALSAATAHWRIGERTGLSDEQHPD